jgi:hypothetical protein
MSSRTKQVLQTVVGLGLAAAMLIWDLPYFAKTYWADIWSVIRTIPLSNALVFQALMLIGRWSYTFTSTGSLNGLSHVKALIVNLCGSSVSNLLPGGGAVGLAATYAICRSWGFSRRATSTSVIVTGVWNDGRMAIIRGLRKSHSRFAATIHREKDFQFVDISGGKRSYYAGMLDAIMRTLPHGKSDVPPEDTLEIIRFIEAANESSETGKTVML